MGGVGQVKPQANIYDFGLYTQDASHQVAPQLFVEPLSGADMLNTRHIRYRLLFEEATHLHTYTESQWAASPVVLLQQKLDLMSHSVAPKPMHCTLKMEVQAFDHVFSSPQLSEGVTQLTAKLYAKKARQLIASQGFEVRVKAPSAVAKGGVIALSQAGGQALQQAIAWANQVVEEHASCH